ncbi:hypothetical protein CMV_026191 [Castanea mollissima]|uniref:Agenet domain-containing protein n=1 Tax=Castanea mollissima TaxID=60419 RepID=A0A8J4QC42_9ROSI|nr:hypothetical protein CMV_026191 [Castanea mollissima]
MSITKEVKASDATAQKMFSKGTLVEVSSDDDGFEGAWFAATIVKAVGKDKFLVQYQSLRTDDDSGFLREEFDTLHIRPCPPETLVVDHFSLFEEVDALYNDGWDTDEEIEFKHSDLRPHQDWIDGKWIMASQALMKLLYL